MVVTRRWLSIIGFHHISANCQHNCVEHTNLRLNSHFRKNHLLQYCFILQNLRNIYRFENLVSFPVLSPDQYLYLPLVFSVSFVTFLVLSLSLQPIFIHQITIHYIIYQFETKWIQVVCKHSLLQNICEFGRKIPIHVHQKHSYLYEQINSHYFCSTPFTTLM